MFVRIRTQDQGDQSKGLYLLDGLIAFKESILKQADQCSLYTANYPLLIQHIIREAKLYRRFLCELERTGTICQQSMREVEMFWNQIMMEHALFIRGCSILQKPDLSKQRMNLHKNTPRCWKRPAEKIMQYAERTYRKNSGRDDAVP